MQTRLLLVHFDSQHTVNSENVLILLCEHSKKKPVLFGLRLGLFCRGEGKVNAEDAERELFCLILVQEIVKTLAVFP